MAAIGGAPKSPVQLIYELIAPNSKRPLRRRRSARLPCVSFLGSAKSDGHLICNSLVQVMRHRRRYDGQWRPEKETAPEGDLSSEAGRRLHLAGEFVVTDCPRLPDGRREVFPKRLFESPEQRFPQRVVVGEIDAVPDVTDA